MMIRSRRVGNQPDSILFLEWPTHFPRALAVKVYRQVPWTIHSFTVHSLHSQTPQESQIVAAWRDSLHVLKLLAWGWVGPKHARNIKIDQCALPDRPC